MAIQLQPTENSIWTIVQAIIQLVQGRGDYVGNMTLRPNQTTTFVPFVNCSTKCKPILTPLTANAAAAIPTTFISAISQGGFTVSHASAATADRTFGFACVGG